MMEQRIVNDDEQFSIVTETMVDGLIAIDAVGFIRHVNTACECLFPYDNGALFGKNVSTQAGGEAVLTSL